LDEAGEHVGVRSPSCGFLRKRVVIPEQEAVILKLEADIVAQQRLWRRTLCALCAFLACIVGMMWRRNPDLLCDYFGSTMCITLGMFFALCGKQASPREGVVLQASLGRCM
jgi:hypothetical protein